MILLENGDSYGIFVCVEIFCADCLTKFARKSLWFTSILGMFQNVPAFVPF
jgi:hypothetical protein